MTDGDDQNGAELDSIAEALTEIDGVTVSRRVPAAELCTYRVGGPIAVLATVSSSEALFETAEAMARTEVPTLAIGRGSNLLVADRGFPGVGFVLAGSCADHSIDGTVVRAGAAALLPVVARASAAADLTGFEWAVGVPGSIGGAVRMNAGGHGSDMAASLKSVEIADFHLGGVFVRDAASLDLRYRHSNLRSWEVVASATLQLEEGEPGAPTETIGEIVAWRREHQPGGPNAGSVFTNPEEVSAGELIDRAGGKGRRHGTAEVSEKHANFIQADPGGSADDVLALMVEVVELVEEKHGVTLSAETRLVGFDEETVARVQPPVGPAGENTAGG